MAKYPFVTCPGCGEVVINDDWHYCPNCEACWKKCICNEEKPKDNK